MTNQSGNPGKTARVLEGINEDDDESGTGSVDTDNEKPIKEQETSHKTERLADPETKHEPKHEPKKPRVEPSMKHLPIKRSSSATRLSNDEAVERYYERNAHTVHGRDRNQDSINRMQQRMKPRRSRDGISILSSPGAVGEPVVPITRHFDRSMYWFAFNRKRIGLRHICVALMVLSYTILGAFMFWTIESRNERQTTMDHVTKLEELLHSIAENITETVNDINTTTTESEMKIYIREAYVTLMKLEGQYKGSTYYKLEDEDHWKWTFESAFFFSMNVYTTTGYGSIAPESTLGQILVCVYGFIFVPVTLVALRDLGQFFLVKLTKLYAHLIQRYRELNGDRHVDENEIIRIPIKACLLLLAAYLAFCTIFIHFFDELSGDEPGSGMSAFLCFYFSFISLSTIGLGDIMPNNATFSPIISIMFFFGMALTKVVNRNTFIAIENLIFGVLTLIENKLEGIVQCTEPTVDKPIRPKAPEFQRALSVEERVAVEKENTNEMLNNFTVRSLATFMKSNTDIYGGGFGRVQLRRGDLMASDHQMTTSSQHKEPTHHDTNV